MVPAWYFPVRFTEKRHVKQEEGNPQSSDTCFEGTRGHELGNSRC